MNDKQFFRFAGIVALLTALTTIGVHFITFQADTFEQRLLLGRNSLYNFQKWLIIFHCLMVIVSMFGVAVWVWQKNKGLAALGALFFAVFGITEIGRMFTVLIYLNGLREKYLAATDDTMKKFLEYDLNNFGLVGNVFFNVFIVAFALGNLFFGLSLIKEIKLDRWMGIGFLAWSMLTFLAFGNDFWQNAALGSVVEVVNKFFQPAIRTVIGWWLLKKSFYIN